MTSVVDGEVLGLTLLCNVGLIDSQVEARTSLWPVEWIIGGRDIVRGVHSSTIEQVTAQDATQCPQSMLD